MGAIMEGITSLWKAPTRKAARKLAVHGFRRSEFPGTSGEFPDGKAYFAARRELAQTYASAYGAGIIEVQISRREYETHFAKFEEIELASGEVQVAIPRDFLRLLNKLTLRRIW